MRALSVPAARVDNKVLTITGIYTLTKSAKAEAGKGARGRDGNIPLTMQCNEIQIAKQ